MQRRPERGPVQVRNYRLVQIDSVFVGVVSAAGTFLPVFLVRLGASGSAVGLLTSLPALTAFALAIPFGRWLQRRGEIVRWYSRLRLVAWLSYGVMGLAAALLPRPIAIPAILAVWGAASLPSTAGLVAFPIVMDGAAGPDGRFDLLGRRWAMAGVSTAVTVAVAGQALARIPFPTNFELLLGAISLAGVGSFLISRRLTIPEQPRPAAVAARDPGRIRALGGLRALRDLVTAESSFVRYELRSVVFSGGIGMATPLLPLLYVREVHAPDSWIGVIGSAQSAGAVLGYVLGRRTSRRRGGTAVLLPSMGLAAVLPAAMASASLLPVVAALAFVNGLATAGTQLALFNELMKRVPRAHGVTFSSVDQSIQNLGLIVAPSIGGVLATTVGVRDGLLAAAAVALVGFVLFVLEWRSPRRSGSAHPDPGRRLGEPIPSPADPLPDR